MLFTRAAMDLLAFILLLLLAILPIGSAFPFSVSTITSDMTVVANSTAMLAHRRLMRRQCEWDPAKSKFVCDEFLPSLKEMFDRMRDGNKQGLVDAGHHVAFFTGLNKDMQATGQLIAGWFASRSLHFCWCKSCIDQNWFKAQLKWIEDSIVARTHPDEWGDDPVDDFLGCHFQAMALAVVNPDVYVFAPRGYEWKEVSAWMAYEYWALTGNTNVRRIWRVDPTDPSERTDLSDDEKCHWNDPVIEWDRDNGGQQLPAKLYCRIKYDTEGEPWVSWGPPPVLSKTPPPGEPDEPESSAASSTA